jgi:hypothetical protein
MTEQYDDIQGYAKANGLDVDDLAAVAREAIAEFDALHYKPVVIEMVESSGAKRRRLKAERKLEAERARLGLPPLLKPLPLEGGT